MLNEIKKSDINIKYTSTDMIIRLLQQYLPSIETFIIFIPYNINKNTTNMEQKNSEQKKEGANQNKLPYNPSAFPRESYKTTIEEHFGGFTVPIVVRDDVEGMSLRDYFAGQALAGMAANLNNYTIRGKEPNAKNISDAAYLMAEAMLKERSKYE